MATPASFDAIEEAAILRHGTAPSRPGLPYRPAAPCWLATGPSLPLADVAQDLPRRPRVQRGRSKWPAFEEVFWGFAIERCAALSDERIEELLADRRLIRHLGKLRSIRSNAGAILGLLAEGRPLGGWLAAWPASDTVGLWDELARRFSQLGGNSGPYFLRMAGGTPSSSPTAS